jgi:hypothetical protein
MKHTYTPSKLLPGEGELLRERAFTNWLSSDLHQAAAHFMINVGLVAIYAECGSDNRRRNILWHPPELHAFEFRSGRSRGNFEKLDHGNIERGWPLLTLHINESDVYSAIWVSASQYEAAKLVLARYGITPAERTLLA